MQGNSINEVISLRLLSRSIFEEITNTLLLVQFRKLIHTYFIDNSCKSRFQTFLKWEIQKTGVDHGIRPIT